MKKKKQNKKVVKRIIITAIIFVLLLLVGLFFLFGGGLQGVLGGHDFGNPSPNNNNCYLLFRTPQSCPNILSTATITDGKYSNCDIGYRYIDTNGTSSDWNYYKSVDLDANGQGSFTYTPNAEGSYIFRTICSLNGQTCSADATLQVLNCDETFKPQNGCTNETAIYSCGELKDKATCEQYYQYGTGTNYPCEWHDLGISSVCEAGRIPCVQ